MKVCWISNAPAPYKVAFMNELGKRVKLTCLFETHAESDRVKQWYDYNSENFTSIYLDEVEETDILQALAKDCDLLINSDYSQRVCQKAVEFFHEQGKPTFLQADGGLAVRRGLLDRFISNVMRKNDYFLSSGLETDEYFKYYRVDEEMIGHFRFSAMSEEEFKEHQALVKDKQKYRESCGYEEEIILLSIGSPIKRKGFDILVRAMVGMPENVGLYIVGGNPQADVKKFVDKNGLKHVHFLPFFDQKTIKEYYAAADIFVLATRYDIWGLVINEAMSYGLPFITTDHCVAGKEFTNQKECGLIVPKEDVQALHEALLSLVEHPEKREALGQAGKELIKAYTYENMAEDFVKEFKARGIV